MLFIMLPLSPTIHTNDSLIDVYFVLSVATTVECNIESKKENESEKSEMNPEKETTLQSENIEDEEGDVPVWKGVVYLLVGGILIGLFSESFIQYVHTVEVKIFCDYIQRDRRYINNDNNETHLQSDFTYQIFENKIYSFKYGEFVDLF